LGFAGKRVLHYLVEESSKSKIADAGNGGDGDGVDGDGGDGDGLVEE
jgi:hypothetical protein